MPPSKFEFPRRSEPVNSDSTETEVANPAGITIIPDKTFKDLDPQTQAQIKNRELTLAEAIKASGFEPYDGAKSILVNPELDQEINERYQQIKHQNETAEAIFNQLSVSEETQLRNALALFLSDHRRTLDPQQSPTDLYIAGPTVNNLYTLIDTIKRNSPDYLTQSYTLQELYQTASTIEVREKRETKARQYSTNLVALLEEPADPNLEETLYQLFVSTSPTAWHEQAKARLNPTDWQALTKAIADFETLSYGDHQQDPRKQGRLTESFLTLLNLEKPAENIGSFELTDGTIFEMWRLYRKTDLEEESKVLGHCVGEGNTYYFKIRGDNPTHAIISLRQPNQPAEWTLELDLTEQTLEQFKGGGDRPVNSIPESTELILATLNQLAKNGLKIKIIKEKLSGTITYHTNDQSYRSLATQEPTIESVLMAKARGETIITPIKLTLDKNTTQEEVLALAELPKLTLDATNLNPQLKNQLTKIAGNLIDSSPIVSYSQLTEIGGTTNFHRLTLAKGLESLAKISGTAYFGNLNSYRGLESLTEIGGTAYFDSLKDKKWSMTEAKFVPIDSTD